MTPRLEHANLAVRDVDATVRFLQTAFPAFRIRRDKPAHAIDDVQCPGRRSNLIINNRQFVTLCGQTQNRTHEILPVNAINPSGAKYYGIRQS